MKKQQPCTNCGEPLKRIRITYRYPSPELFERAERGEVVLGGCQPDGPTHACSACREPVVADERPAANGARRHG